MIKIHGWCFGATSGSHAYAGSFYLSLCDQWRHLMGSRITFDQPHTDPASPYYIAPDDPRCILCGCHRCSHRCCRTCVRLYHHAMTKGLCTPEWCASRLSFPTYRRTRKGRCMAEWVERRVLAMLAEAGILEEEQWAGGPVFSLEAVEALARQKGRVWVP